MRTVTAYIELKPGDIRQQGDEYRHTVNPNDHGVWNRLDKVQLWRPVSLVGHKILPADCIVGQFRREVK